MVVTTELYTNTSQRYPFTYLLKNKAIPVYKVHKVRGWEGRREGENPVQLTNLPYLVIYIYSI